MDDITKAKIENFKMPKRQVHTVFLHCSASSNPKHDDVSVIAAWHKERGFSEVGYHFFIKTNGQLQTGRNLEKIPAAQKPYNTGTIAICLHGLYPEDFTEAQRKTLLALCAKIDLSAKDNIRFRGHKEVAAKACPVFDYKRWLGLDKDGSMSIKHLVLSRDISDRKSFKVVESDSLDPVNYPNNLEIKADDLLKEKVYNVKRLAAIVNRKITEYFSKEK